MLILSKIKHLIANHPIQKQNNYLNIYKTSLLLKCYQHEKLNNEAPTKDNILTFCDQLDTFSHGNLKDFIQTECNSQILHLFSRIHEYHEYYHEDYTQTIANSTELRKHIGYATYLDHSKLPDAGTGVFVNGDVCAGTIVALFPGLVHLREYTGKSNYVEKNLLPDPNFF